MDWITLHSIKSRYPRASFYKLDGSYCGLLQYIDLCGQLLIFLDALKSFATQSLTMKSGSKSWPFDARTHRFWIVLCKCMHKCMIQFAHLKWNCVFKKLTGQGIIRPILLHWNHAPETKAMAWTISPNLWSWKWNSKEVFWF